MQFKDKVVVVTGGSKGIGKGIAMAFAERGAKVVISARKQADLEAAAGEIKAAGGQVTALVCDVTSQEQIDALVAETLAAYGPVDILVNNAGIAGSHKFLSYPDELWNKIIDINLTGVFRVSRAFAPQMVEKGGGRIIHIASIAGKKADRYMAAYAASKHGVLGLTKAMAVELNPAKITVNAICPGYVDTPMTDATIATMTEKTSLDEAGALKVLESLSPQQRLIDVEEVVEVALMLAGENARGITGQAINVDGGTVM